MLLRASASPGPLLVLRRFLSRPQASAMTTLALPQVSLLGRSSADGRVQGVRAGNETVRSHQKKWSSFSTSLRSSELPSLTGVAGGNLSTGPSRSSGRFWCYAAQSGNGATFTVGLTSAAPSLTPQIGIQVAEGLVSAWQGDILAVGVFEEALEVGEEGGAFKDAELAELDAATGGVLKELAGEEEFKAKPGQSTFSRVTGQPFRKIGLIGLGKKASVLGGVHTAAPWKALGASLAAAAKPSRAGAVGLALLGLGEMEEGAKGLVAESIGEGLVVGAFEDVRFKSERKPPALTSATLFGLGASEGVAKKAAAGAQVAQGVILGKELVNAPPNVLTPQSLADEAAATATAHPDVFSAKILTEAECRELKMGSYLGVAAASENAPRFIHLTYRPPGPEAPKKKLVIIGKGLTFDSGGYNLKVGPGSMIELMKFDMGGAAATIGAAKAIGLLKPVGVEVHFIVAACENMISGGGMRPGDILTASNGKTIEVNNTDAEGRLTLADALVYACKLGEVDAIVDLATLTGACIIALGNDIGGLFTPSDSLSAELSAASSAAGEKLWRMPMEEGYKEQLKSSAADMVNTGGRAGGSITAALFLKEFVDPSIPWAHLDIAGPVWNDKKGGPTGFGVSTLVKWVESHAS